MIKRNAILSKDFLLVAAGQIISLFGNQILRYALPLYLLSQTGSSALFGAISACAFIPMLVLFPVGGIIADRVNKRNIMVVLDFSTAALALLFSALVDRVDIVPLMAVTMIVLYGIQGAYQPAVKASVPALVGDSQIMQANSIVDVISSVAGLAGPVIGGILFSWVGLAPILYISIGCFAASAVMELFLHIPFEKRRTAGNLFATGFHDLRQSFHFMFRQQPVLWKMSLTYASVNLFLTSLVLIGVPVLVTQHFGFSVAVSSRLYGYAQGAIAAGCILGGLLAGALANRLKPHTIPVLLAGCALSMLVGGLALQTLTEPFIAYLALTASCGLLLTLATLLQIPIMTYLQILTPQHLTGKVISCVMCVCMCTNPLGQLMYGMVFEKIGSRTYLPFYAAALVMLGISAFTRPIFRGIGRLKNTKPAENNT